jgi:hypothetical protein
MILKYIPSRPIRSLLERGEGGGWENGIGAWGKGGIVNIHKSLWYFNIISQEPWFSP